MRRPKRISSTSSVTSASMSAGSTLSNATPSSQSESLQLEVQTAPVYHDDAIVRPFLLPPRWDSFPDNLFSPLDDPFHDDYINIAWGRSKAQPNFHTLGYLSAAAMECDYEEHDEGSNTGAAVNKPTNDFDLPMSCLRPAAYQYRSEPFMLKTLQ